MSEPPRPPLSSRGDETPSRRRVELVARVARLAFAGAVAALAGALVAVSAVDYEALKEHVDTFSIDRDADVSRGEYDRLVVRLRLLAVVLACLAAAVLLFRSRLDRVTAAVLSDWGLWLQGQPRALREWARSAGPLHVAALVVVLAIGVALRVAYLDMPMRYDEAATYNAFVSKPLYIGLANYSVPNNHLFHTFLAKVSLEAFGNNPWSLRLPALLAGIALIPASYGLARIVYGRTAALLTAALVATSSTLVEYSTNARGYTLVALLTVGALLAAVRVLESGSLGGWAALGVCGILGLYAVPTMVYAFGGVLVWILGSVLLRGDRLQDVLAPLGGCVAFVVVLTGLLYVPVLAASGPGSVTSNSFVEPKPLTDFVVGLPDHVGTTVQTWGRDLPLAGSLVLLCGVLASLALSGRVSRYPFPPLAAILLWSVPFVLVQRVLPFTRVWLYLVPIVLATSAGFFGWLLERRGVRELVGEAGAVLVAAGAAVLILSADSVRTSTETGALPDGPAIAEYLGDTLRPGDSVLAIGSDAILSYYLEREGRDASSAIWQGAGRRIVVVVNLVNADQTLQSALGELPADVEHDRPRLLRSWPSAALYLVRTV